MDERMQLVARRLAGEPMAELCREFGISRKTGYKIFDRYQECGIQGLTDRSRRPYGYANQLPFQVENFILNVKQEHPSWGARKIRERLIRRFSGIPFQPRARSMRCWIATVWSSAAAGCVVGLKGRSYPWGSGPTSYGAPTTKASSCSEIINTATRSQ
jgi:transposase